MTPLPLILYRDLLNKPFEAGGRGPSSYDCVGLVLEVARRQGLVLPAYLSDEAELHRQVAEGGALDAMHKLHTPEPGCVVLLRMVAGARHVGTMLDRFRVLHTSEQTRKPVIESILAQHIEHRVLGFYRLEAQ